MRIKSTSNATTLGSVVENLHTVYNRKKSWLEEIQIVETVLPDGRYRFILEKDVDWLERKKKIKNVDLMERAEKICDADTHDIARSMLENYMLYKYRISIDEFNIMKLYQYAQKTKIKLEFHLNSI